MSSASPTREPGTRAPTQLGKPLKPASASNLACGNLASGLLPNPRSETARSPVAGYLECGSHIGEVGNAASNDEDLACVWSQRRSKRLRKVDADILPEIQQREFSLL